MADHLPGAGLVGVRKSSVEVRSQHSLGSLEKAPPSRPPTWRPGPRASQVAVRMGMGVHLTPAQDRCGLERSQSYGDPKVLLPQPAERVSPLLRKGSF